jgi:hypothetical protein
LLAGRKVNEEEQTEARRMRRRVRWEQVVAAAEPIKGSKWEQWVERRGDWARDGTIYAAVRYGRLRLAEVARPMAGLRYQAAAQAVKRFGPGLEKDPQRRRFVGKLRRVLFNI